MPITDLADKFRHELGDVYDAEHQFLETMQEMVSICQNPTVQSLLQEHIQETKHQIKNLEHVYQFLGLQPVRVRCEGAAGIVSEARKLLQETSGSPALADLAIAGGWAKGEHYEIASYRGLIEGAELMGQQQAAVLLRQNLQQEEQTAARIEQSAPRLLQHAMSVQERGR